MAGELATAVCTTACLAALEALVVLARGMTEAAAVAAAAPSSMHARAGVMPRKLLPGQLHAPFSMMCSRRGWLKELDRLFRPAYGMPQAGVMELRGLFLWGCCCCCCAVVRPRTR